jgi:hypothetical protein
MWKPDSHATLVTRRNAIGCKSSSYVDTHVRHRLASLLLFKGLLGPSWRETGTCTGSCFFFSVLPTSPDDTISICFFPLEQMKDFRAAVMWKYRRLLIMQLNYLFYSLCLCIWLCISMLYCKLIYIVTYFRSVTIDGVWIDELDLLTTCTHHSELQVITALPRISAFYKSLHAKSFPSLLCLQQPFLATACNTGNSSSSRAQVLLSQSPVQNSTQLTQL